MLDNFVKIGGRSENSSQLPAGQFCLPERHASLHPLLHYYSPYHAFQLIILQNIFNKGLKMCQKFSVDYNKLTLSIHMIICYHHL